MKKLIKQSIACGMVVALLVPTVVSAHEGEHDESTSDDHSGEMTTQQSTPDQKRTEELRKKIEQRLQERKSERESKTEDKKAELKQRLSDAKKKICEKHEAQINKVISVINTRRQNAFDRITKVSDAVQKFVSEKNVTVANYDELVATVAAAKASAESAMNEQESVPEISCDGEHPKADLSSFKEKRLGSIDAMKEYRDSVKALVKAVREVTEAGAEQ